MAGGPAVQQDQRRSIAGNTVMKTLTVVGDKGLHLVQHLLPTTALLDFLAAAAGTGGVTADLGFLMPDG
jgi:hypothetical protein